MERRSIPFQRAGGRLLFDRSELRAYAEGRAMIDLLPKLDIRGVLPKLRLTYETGQRRGNALALDTED